MSRNRRALAEYIGGLTFVSSAMAARLETGFLHCDRCPPHRGENWSRPKRTAKFHKTRRPLSLSEVSCPVMAWELPEMLNEMFDDDRFLELNWEFDEWDVVYMDLYDPYPEEFEVMTESRVIPRPAVELPEPREVVCIRGVDVYLD